MRFAVLLGLLAACGDGLPGPDASVEGGTTGELVRVRSGRPGDQVLFLAPDSSVVLVTQTDAIGEASAYMPPGGSVTVVTLNGAYQMFTWLDVQGGDELTLGELVETAPEFELNVPRDVASSTYELFTPCGATSIQPAAGAWLALRLDGCPARLTMLVEALGPTTARYLYQEDIAIFEDAMISLAGPYLPTDTARLEVSGAPAGATTVLAAQSLVSQGKRIFCGPSGCSLGTNPSASMVLSDGAGSATAEIPLPPAATLVTEAVALEPTGATVGARVVHWGPAATEATARIDFSAPHVRALASPPVYDRASHTVRWTESADGLAPNVTVAMFAWARAEDGSIYTWKIVGPRTGEPVMALPRLPGAFVPRDGDIITNPDGLQFESMAVSSSYDTLRAHLLTRSDEVRIPIVEPSGTASYVEGRHDKFD